MPLFFLTGFTKKIIIITMVLKHWHIIFIYNPKYVKTEFLCAYNSIKQKQI